MGTCEEGLGIKLDPTLLEHYEYIVKQADDLALERTSQINTAQDFTSQLKKMAGAGRGFKVLLLHGDSDQGMPIEASSRIVREILGEGAELRVYEKAAHGLYLTHQDKVMEDIVEFVRRVDRPIAEPQAKPSL